MIETGERFARFELAWQLRPEELLEAFRLQRWCIRACFAILVLMAFAEQRSLVGLAGSATAALLLALVLPRLERALILRTQRRQLEETRFWGDAESTHVASFSQRFDRSWMAWRRLRVGPSVLSLGVSPWERLVIPARAFRDEDEMSRFIALAARSVEID